MTNGATFRSKLTSETAVWALCQWNLAARDLARSEARLGPVQQVRLRHRAKMRRDPRQIYSRELREHKIAREKICLNPAFIDLLKHD